MLSSVEPKLQTLLEGDLLALGYIKEDEVLSFIGAPSLISEIEALFEINLLDELTFFHPTGKPGEIFEIPVLDSRTSIDRLYLVGAGDQSLTSLRAAGAALGRKVRGKAVHLISLLTSEKKEDAAAVSAHAISMALGAYTWQLKSGTPPEIPQLSVASQDQASIIKASSIAEGVSLARDLIHTPANIKNPLWLAQEAKKIASEKNLEIKVLSGRELRQFGGLVAVGGSSPKPGPRLIQVTYEPKSKKKSSSKMERSGMGSEDVNVGMPRSKINATQLISKLEQIKELTSMGKQDRNVKLNISNLINQLEEEIDFTPAPKKKSKKQSKPKVELVEEEPKPKDDRPNVSEQQKANLKKNLGSREASYKNAIDLLKKNNMSYEDFLKERLNLMTSSEKILNELVETAKKYTDGAKILQPYIDIFENIYDVSKDIPYTNESELITYFLNLKDINEKNIKQVSFQYGELIKIQSTIKSKKYKNLIQKRIDELQEIYDNLSKKQPSKEEDACLELLKKLNIVTRSDFNKQFVKYKKEAREKGFQEFEKYPPYVELSNCRRIFEDQLLKNPQQAKSSARAGPVAPVAPQAKPLLLKYLSREELYKLIEAKATPK